MDRGSADAFTEMGTIGIEEEFYVVDTEGRPTAGSDTLVYESDPPEILDGRIDHELFKCVIETQTPKIPGPSEIDSTIAAVRNALVDHAQAHGYQIAAAGLHPAGKWRELEHAQKPRYREQLDRIQYPQHRNITAGLHVHVGVDDADKATWIANELRWYVAPILALSVNSPYWYGFDTGLQSARATIFESLPNTGIPTAFEDFDEYLAFERQMIKTGSINDRGELWFDVRPHSAHGTVEMRSPDTQGDPQRVSAFVRYIHALVEDLAAQYEDGASQTNYRREILDENKWRALRYGHDASFIQPDGTTVSLETVVNEECDRLGVEGIRALYEEPSGAEQQRTRRNQAGLDGLCETLVI